MPAQPSRPLAEPALMGELRSVEVVDFLDPAELERATVRVVYLLPEAIAGLQTRLLECVQRGARLVCNTWGLVGVAAAGETNVADKGATKLWLYTKAGCEKASEEPEPVSADLALWRFSHALLPRRGLDLDLQLLAAVQRLTLAKLHHPRLSSAVSFELVPDILERLGEHVCFAAERDFTAAREDPEVEAEKLFELSEALDCRWEEARVRLLAPHPQAGGATS